MQVAVRWLGKPSKLEKVTDAGNVLKEIKIV